MLDLYGLPRDFPGKEEAAIQPSPLERVRLIEQRLVEAVADKRFIPHLQLHEYESLLFANADAFYCYFTDRVTYGPAIRQLSQVRNQFESPEDIDDGPLTAPSKRIIDLIPTYAPAKPLAGVQIAQNIGVSTSMRECPHFGAWVSKLSALRP